MEHVKDVVKRAMAIVYQRNKSGRTMDDHVYDVLIEGSEDFRLLGMEQQGDLIIEIIENLIDRLEDRHIVTLATVILKRDK